MRILHLIIGAIPLFGAYAADNSLQATLARMDEAAAKYKGMKANVSRLSHLEVIKQDDVENGRIAALRSNPKDVRMLIWTQPPNERKVLVTPNKVEVYYPKMNTVQEYGFGKVGGLKDQLLLLSFGTTSKSLLSAYTVTAGPAETVAGQKTTRLDLVPKNKELLAYYPKIHLWISDDNGVALQQKLNERSGDYNQATYTDIELTNVSEADVKLDIPKNAKREKIN